MGWDEMRWHEARRNQIFWDEMKCGMWSASVKHEVRGVKGAVRSVRKVFVWRCIAMWPRARHVLGCSWTTTVQQVRAKHAFTHGPGWRTVLASSIGEKGLIIKSKATSAPPRAGTTGIYIYIYLYILIYILIYIYTYIYIYHVYINMYIYIYILLALSYHIPIPSIPITSPHRISPSTPCSSHLLIKAAHIDGPLQDVGAWDHQRWNERCRWYVWRVQLGLSEKWRYPKLDGFFVDGKSNNKMDIWRILGVSLF